MDNLNAIIADFRATASFVDDDGRQWWPRHSDRLLHSALVEIARRLDVLDAELQPEGPAALRSSTRQVEALEQRLEALQSGEMPW